jgi:hypothetical protein
MNNPCLYELISIPDVQMLDLLEFFKAIEVDNIWLP